MCQMLGIRRGTRWELSVVTWFPWDPVVLGEADGLGEIGDLGVRGPLR